MIRVSSSFKIWQIRIGGIALATILVIYLYKIIVAREMFDTFTFVLLLLLGIVAFFAKPQGHYRSKVRCRETMTGK